MILEDNPHATSVEEAMTQRRVCGVRDLGSGRIVQVEIDGRAPVAVYQLDDGIYCTDDTCTHEDAPLSSGEIDGDCVVCPFHLGAFNIKTGEAVRAPCSVDLRTYPVTIVGDDVFVGLD